MSSLKELFYFCTIGLILLTSALSVKHKKARHIAGLRRSLNYKTLHLPENPQPHQQTSAKKKNQTQYHGNPDSDSGKRHLMKVRVFCFCMNIGLMLIGEEFSHENRLMKLIVGLYHCESERDNRVVRQNVLILTKEHCTFPGCEFLLPAIADFCRETSYIFRI